MGTVFDRWNEYWAPFFKHGHNQEDHRSHISKVCIHYANLCQKRPLCCHTSHILESLWILLTCSGELSRSDWSAAWILFLEMACDQLDRSFKSIFLSNLNINGILSTCHSLAYKFNDLLCCFDKKLFW